MDKNTLRKVYKEKRGTLDSETMEDLSIAIANNALRSRIWHHSTYHIFLPISRQKEIDTSYLLTIIQGKDKNAVISRSDFSDGSMRHYLLTDSTVIRNNSYGIPEPQSGIELHPEQLDVVFIPLLAYDTLGNRVGYGKGYYDRFLASCRKDVLKIGLSFFEPCEPISDISENDIPLDMCITPETVYEFRT